MVTCRTSLVCNCKDRYPDISSSTNARETAPNDGPSANGELYLMLFKGTTCSKWDQWKTTSFPLPDLKRDLPSAVLGLDRNSPGRTDLILGRKQSAKSPGIAPHLLGTRKSHMGHFRAVASLPGIFWIVPSSWFQGGRAEPPLWTDALPAPKHADPGGETVICSKVACACLSLLALKGTILSKEAGVLNMC